MSRWLGHALAIAGRDLRREARRRDHVVGTLLLGLLVLLVFAFATGAGEGSRQTVPGVLWLAVLLPGMQAGGRSFVADAERGTLDGLLLAPVDRGAVYAGKTVATVATVLVVEAVVLAAAVALFGLPPPPPALLAALAVGAVGFGALATLFGALVLATRAREVLLPALLLPVAVPLLIAGVQVGDEAFGAEASSGAYPWLALAAGVSALYLSAGLLLIDHVLEEA